MLGDRRSIRFCEGPYPSSWMQAIEHAQQYSYPEEYVGQWHTGCDLNRWDRRDYGAPFYAAAAGTVASIARVNNDSDVWIVLAHARGYDTRYGHAKDYAVRLGEEVDARSAAGLDRGCGRDDGSASAFRHVQEGVFKVNARTLGWP